MPFTALTRFLSEIASAGVRVTLAEGDKKTQDLRISGGSWWHARLRVRYHPHFMRVPEEFSRLRQLMTSVLALALVVGVSAAPQQLTVWAPHTVALEKIDEAVNAKIRAEGMDRSTITVT